MPPSTTAGGFEQGTIPAPSAEAFFGWLEREISADSVDLLLFFGNAGRKLQRMASAADRSISRPVYIPLNGAAILLAGIEATSLVEQLPLILSLGEGLLLDAWFKGLEIPLPAAKFISDIGLRSDTSIEPASADLLARFLYAYRWEIFKVCRERRRELFRRYLEAGIMDGMRIGIVDLGWEGKAQMALNHVLNSTFRVQTYGYSFFLQDDSQGIALRQAIPSRAMISADTHSEDVLRMVSSKRHEIEEQISLAASGSEKAALAARL